MTLSRMERKKAQKVYQQTYYARHREEILDTARRKRAEDPERLREYQRQYYRRHRKKILARQKLRYRKPRTGRINDWNKRHPERARAIKRKWYLQNRTRILAYEHTYYMLNRERILARRKLLRSQKNDQQATEPKS